MKRTVAAQHIACPECNTTTKVTCLKYGDEGTLRIRYRKCPSCNHKFKTWQQVTAGPEVIKDYPTQEERRVIHCFDRSSLTEEDVLDIMDQLKKGFWTRKDIALQYEVSPCVIRDIDVGKTFKHLTTAPS